MNKKTHLNFEETPNEGRKTLRYEVVNTSDIPLGEIKWQTGWRRYAFYPANDCLFDSDCLKEITNFIKRSVKPIHRFSVDGM